MGKPWRDELDDLRNGVAPDPGELSALQGANRDMIHKAMLGYGPDARRPDERAGQRLVYNVSSAHVPQVIGAKYLNRYELPSTLGARRASRLREQIDALVAEIAGNGQTPQTTYYGAVELNGTGIRYFGDFCLVLKPDAKRQDLLLVTNSYDVHRSPLRDTVVVKQDRAQTAANRKAVLQQWAGRWPADAPDMAVLKLGATVATTRRRLTIGTIAANVLVDEDYLEVPRNGTFGADDIEEIRLSAADVAAEARIADRLAIGPVPDLSELLWRHRRRGAEQAARKAGIKVRVVVTMGRDRG